MLGSCVLVFQIAFINLKTASIYFARSVFSPVGQCVEFYTYARVDTHNFLKVWLPRLGVVLFINTVYKNSTSSKFRRSSSL